MVSKREAKLEIRRVSTNGFVVVKKKKLNLLDSKKEIRNFVSETKHLLCSGFRTKISKK